MDRQKQIAAAQEKVLPELVLKNAKIVNVFTGEILSGDVAITDGYIVGVGRYRGQTERDVDGRYIVPGFVDAHLHIESSMVMPDVYAMEALRHGTTTIITDPHEIVNVSGAEALRDILHAAACSPLNYYVMLPSCVPATPFEHAGAVMTAADLLHFKENSHVLGLGEMMNAVGVINGDPVVLDKLAAFDDKIIDGHAPGLTGHALLAYVGSGILTDHESVTFEEVLEKLRCGMAVLVREGSASRNLEAIVKGLVDRKLYSSRLAFCTDDKHLADIRREGTISSNIRQAIALGMPPIEAIRMATINAAQIYRLPHIGAVACGYRADIVVLDDLDTVKIHEVYKDGAAMSAMKMPEPMHYSEKLMNSVHIAPLSEETFVIPPQKEYDVIGLVPHQILTEKIHMTQEELNAGLQDGTVCKIAVIERHHATGCHACAYLKGYGLRKGAVGTTVAHDSHNIIVVGTNDADMRAAVEELVHIKGGYTIVSDGAVVDSLPLPLGGLMSALPAEEFIPRLDAIIRKAYAVGVKENIDPFITLSFTALPVLPAIRITDQGLFDAENFRFLT